MKKLRGGFRLTPMCKTTEAKVGETLICRECKQEKTLDHFSKSNAFYYDKKCKECKSEAAKKKWAERDQPMF